MDFLLENEADMDSILNEAERKLFRLIAINEQHVLRTPYASAAHSCTASLNSRQRNYDIILLRRGYNQDNL